MFESLSARLSEALKKVTGRGVLRSEDVEAGLREVRLALLEADVNFKVVKQFTEKVRARLAGAEISPGLTAPQTVVKAVQDELVELLGGNTRGLNYSSQPPTVVMLVGLQGSGKTTTAVKLALLARREGHKPVVVGLDSSRPAATEQLKTLAERNGVAFASPSGPSGHLPMNGEDVVILDTAGRLHVDDELMGELKRLKASTRVTETFLVADSMTGQEAVRIGEAFAKEVGLDGVILTKLDGDARGGAALSLRAATGQQVRFAGTGEKPEDLEVFQAERVASRILGMGDVLSLIEKAERALDNEKAVDVEKHLRAGQLSFDDFLAQIRQLRGMGSLEAMLDLVPGGASLKGQVASAGRAQGAQIDPDVEMRKMEAIILSMTPKERARPDLIDGARRRRIARGSGVQPADVNRLLKARESMQKLARQFGGVNRKGRSKKVGIPRMYGQGGAGW